MDRMAGYVDPQRWQRYVDGRWLGYSRRQAANFAGVSIGAARLFDHERGEEAAGRPSERKSSGWAWVEWREKHADDPNFPRLVTPGSLKTRERTSA